jgi:hypothetical protein
MRIRSICTSAVYIQYPNRDSLIFDTLFPVSISLIHINLLLRVVAAAPLKTWTPTVIPLQTSVLTWKSMEEVWMVAAAFSASVRKKSESWKISVRFTVVWMQRSAASTIHLGPRDLRLGREISYTWKSTTLPLCSSSLMHCTGHRSFSAIRVLQEHEQRWNARNSLHDSSRRSSSR